MAALDIAEPQVLIFYENDPVFQWHHRLLLRRLSDAVWVVSTPDRKVQVVDLATVRILALPRAGGIPDHVAGNVYLFEQPLTDAELQDLHAAAARTAAVLGGGAVAPEDAIPGQSHWLVSDCASDLFGEQVADDVVNNGGTGVVRDSVGLARINGVWHPVERVPDAEVDLWETAKRNGGGRDPRLAGDRRDSRGHRWVSLTDAINTFRPVDQKRVPGWPLPGPRASLEVPAGIRASGREIVPYHDLWVLKVGVHKDSAFAWEHYCLLTVLMFMVSYDQIDITNLASGEFVCRRLLQLQRAVRANPRCPSFVGLHKMIEHSLDEAGGVAAKEFSRHIAAEAEVEARIMKQTRLLREETRALDKKGDEGEMGDDASGGKPRGGRRPKNPPP